MLLLPLVGAAFGVPYFLKSMSPKEAAPPDKVSLAPSEDQLQAFVRAEEKLGEVQRSWDRAKTLAPESPHLDPSGELVSRFHGFGVSVTSVPQGAHVIANGVEVGETPLVTSVDCSPGSKVEVQVLKAPFRPWRHTTVCRPDTLVELTFRLGRP